MSADAPDLVTWLRARLDEDERDADDIHELGFCSRISPYADGPCDCAWPARVRADIEAKRRLLERYEAAEARADGYIVDGLSSEPDDYVAERLALEWAVKLAALPHAGHPDYRAEWTP